MAYILQVDFKMNGSFGKEEGFMWKIWTENPKVNEVGGIYSFETKETAKQYLEMHTKRLAGFGITNVNAKIFAINSKLTVITISVVNCSLQLTGKSGAVQ